MGPVDLQLKWGLKQSCGPCQELSNGMWHTTYTQGNWGDSWLLVVGSQIVNSTPNLSFGHNLCFRCPNGSCKPISDIYIPRAFQWYKERFNPMGFDPYNGSLKIWESTGALIPKVGVPLGVWKFILSHFPTLPGTWDATPGFLSWPAPLQAFALVVSTRLGLWHYLYYTNFFVTSTTFWVIIFHGNMHFNHTTNLLPCKPT
jgi:hypothetical protein